MVNRILVKEGSMRILFVSHSSVLKYHQQKLKILASKYGHDIILVSPLSWKEGGRGAELYTGNREIKYVAGDVFTFGNRMLHIYRDAGKIFKKIMPDIVHLEEEPYNAPCFQFIKHAKKYKKKSIFFTWENIRKNYNPVYSFCEKYSLKNSDAAIAGNEEAAGILKSRNFRGEISVMPQYGVNAGDFPRKKAAGLSKKDSVNISFLGRLIPEKGVEYLIEAVKGMEGVRLNIAGSGSGKYIKKLKKKAEEGGGTENIFFHSPVERENVPRFLSETDIVALPSVTTGVWKEQFGRVIIESFAAKAAVIGSSSGEIPNVINGAGLIFPEGNAFELRKKIKMLMNDEELYVRLVNRGYERVLNNYTNNTLADKINEIYKKLAEGKH